MSHSKWDKALELSYETYDADIIESASYIFYKLFFFFWVIMLLYSYLAINSLLFSV